MSEGTFVIDGPGIVTDGQVPGRQVVVSYGDKPDFVPGRRHWVKYRELGVTDATERTMRAQVIHAGVSNENTGWHLHHCDMQFLYVISGSINIAFNPDTVVRLEGGDSLMIPGGTVHMELGAPHGVQVLEVSVPADMGTQAVDSPWGDVQVDADNAVGRATVSA